MQNLSEEYLLPHNLISYNVKSWAIEVPQDSKQVEIVFAFIIPDAPHSYVFGQICLMMEGRVHETSYTSESGIGIILNHL